MPQQGGYTAFTAQDGLPSNHIYRCVEDNKGFLWVATDAGVVRFDGKHFQVYTTEHGVPDNEVLQVAKEKDGTIWINCFKQIPAYFDEARNRFVNVKEDTSLSKVFGTALMQVYVMKDSGIVFFNETGSYIFQAQKLAYYSKFFYLAAYPDGTSLECHRWQNGKTYEVYLVHSAGGRIIDSIPLHIEGSVILSPAMDGGDLFMFDGKRKTFRAYSNIQTRPWKYTVDSAVVPESFFSFSFTSRHIVVLSNSAKVYVYDKKTLALKHIFSGNYLPNGFYDDSKGNSWISTIDKGLLAYRKMSFQQVKMPVGFTRTNFLSIARKQDGTLLAGNYYGEVLEAGFGQVKVHTIVKRQPSRQRKILVAGNNTYVISDGADGIFVNLTKPLVHPVTKNVLGGKTGIVCNDTLLLIGTSYGFVRVNPVKNVVTSVDRYSRVTAVAKANEAEVYMGSTDGLHKYNFIKRKFTSLIKEHVLLSERITGLCITADGLVWIATSGQGIVVLKNDRVLLHMSQKDGIINNACRTIVNGKAGQVWLGTTRGISAINYRLQNEMLIFAVENITENDGLPSNEINEMLYYNDTVYAATGNGISLIPANSSFAKLNIPVHLVRISINQQDTTIASRYYLNNQQQNIQMQFAGIELNGHFKNLQYSMDTSNGWIDMADNNLVLQLNSGEHTVHVRAIDVNGNVSTKILRTHFSVATPFWKLTWFWIIIGVSFQLLSIYFAHRWQKKKKERKLQKELAVIQTASLEQQAFTSLMNPHFMFNALNSIQHYINVQDRRNANRYLSDFASLIRKNFEAAHQSFVTLEEELENLKLYLRLEQMRFSNRFDYNIHIDVRIDIDQWMIPTMMLQPLLENALLHGIMPSSLKGELQINIEERKEGLLIIITDNGIGIENSKNNHSAGSHKSRAMELIQKRITALNRFVKHPIELSSAPAFRDLENPGHRITIFIPGQLYPAWQKVQSSNMIH